MTFALTAFEAYAVEADEPLAKKFIQRVRMKGTAANTNVAYDFGTYAGTFWTAVGSTSPGTTALATFKAIQTSAASFLRVGGTSLAAKGQFPASAPLVTKILSSASVGGAAAEVYTVTGLLTTDTILGVTPSIASATGRPTITALTSAAYGGGSATPTLTVTGLLTTDTILGATQILKNQNSLPLIGAAGTCATNGQYAVTYSADPGTTGTVRVMISRTATTDTYVPVSWGTQATDALTVTYGADPGAGAKVIVSLTRTSTAVPTGNYQIAMDGTNGLLPNLLFLSGNAPTAFDLMLEWELASGIDAIRASASA